MFVVRAHMGSRPSHVVKGPLCRRCGERYAQAFGFCCACGRDLELSALPHQDAAAQTDKRESRIPKTRVIDGVEYEITFDGS